MRLDFVGGYPAQGRHETRSRASRGQRSRLDHERNAKRPNWKGNCARLCETRLQQARHKSERDRTGEFRSSIGNSNRGGPASVSVKPRDLFGGCHISALLYFLLFSTVV